MEPKPTELTIALTLEEAEALENGLADLTFNTGTSDLKAWRAVQSKLRAAMHQENRSNARLNDV